MSNFMISLVFIEQCDVVSNTLIINLLLRVLKGIPHTSHSFCKDESSHVSVLRTFVCVIWVDTNIILFDMECNIVKE